MGILFYPYYVLYFWFLDLPKILLHKFGQINSYLLNLFTIPLLLKTFFQPLKNEYREGLVVFSRAAGVVVKSFLLLIGLSIILITLALEIAFLLITITLPLTLFYFLLIK